MYKLLIECHILCSLLLYLGCNLADTFYNKFKYKKNTLKIVVCHFKLLKSLIC